MCVWPARWREFPQLFPIKYNQIGEVPGNKPGYIQPTCQYNTNILNIIYVYVWYSHIWSVQSSLRPQVSRLSCVVHDMAVNPFGHHWTRTGGGGGGERRSHINYMSCIGMCCHGKDHPHLFVFVLTRAPLSLSVQRRFLETYLLITAPTTGYRTWSLRITATFVGMLYDFWKQFQNTQII